MADPGSLCSGRQVLLAWLSCGQPFSPGDVLLRGKKMKKKLTAKEGRWMDERKKWGQRKKEGETGRK